MGIEMCGREHSGSFVFFYVDASDSSSYQQPSSAQASDAISINTSFWDYFDQIAKMQLNWDGESMYANPPLRVSSKTGSTNSYIITL